MNRYNLAYNKAHPFSEIIRSEFNKSTQDPLIINDDVTLIKLLQDSNLDIHCIKNASIKSISSNFCVYEINPWFPLNKAIQEKEIERGNPFYFDSAQRKTIFLLDSLFPQFSEWVRSLKSLDYNNDIMSVKWSVRYKITHRFLHPAQVECISHKNNNTSWYIIQLLYRSGCWLKGFHDTENFKWNLPMFINLWYDIDSDTKHGHIHPGNSRNMFKEFENTISDVFVVVPDQFSDRFGKLDDIYDYSDPIDAFSKLLETKKAQCFIVKDKHFEAFFLPKKHLLNDYTVLFFEQKQKLLKEYLDNCREIIDHIHNPINDHPEVFPFTYRLTIKLEDSVIYYNDEAVARFDDDGCLLLETENKKFSFNFL